MLLELFLQILPLIQQLLLLMLFISTFPFLAFFWFANLCNSAFGVPPLLNCYSSGGKTILYQIAFCISDTTLDATTCDSCVTNQWAADENCGSNVSLLAINFLPN